MGWSVIVAFPGHTHFLYYLENFHKHVKSQLMYSETCLKRPLKTDKTNVLKTGGSFMLVKNIAECSSLLSTCITQ